jgi:hypothetical protein
VHTEKNITVPQETCPEIYLQEKSFLYFFLAGKFLGIDHKIKNFGRFFSVWRSFLSRGAFETVIAGK